MANEVKIDLRKVLQEKIEMGIESGIRRSYKHMNEEDHPSEDALIGSISYAIWCEIDEIMEL